MIIINKKFSVFVLTSIFCLLFNSNYLYSFSFKKIKKIFTYKNKKFSYVNSLIINHDFDEAEKILFQMLENNYNQKLCFLLLGNLYIKEKNHNLARENYIKALEKFKNKNIKIILYKNIISTFDFYKNSYEIIKTINEAIINECFDTNLLIILSSFYKNMSLDDKAINILKNAYALEPNNLLVNLALIDIYNKKLDYENAIFHFNKIRANNNNFYERNLMLAEIYFKMNKLNKSYFLCQEIYDKIINYKLFLLMGNILYLEKNYNKATEIYKKSFSLLKNNYDEFFTENYKNQNENEFIIENILINLYMIAQKTKNNLLLDEIINETKNKKLNRDYIDKNIKYLDIILNS